MRHGRGFRILVTVIAVFLGVPAVSAAPVANPQAAGTKAGVKAPSSGVPVSSPPASSPPLTPQAPPAGQQRLLPTELPAPVIQEVAPKMAGYGGIPVTVRGQSFGPSQEGRKIILAAKAGGQQIMPAIRSWSHREIVFTAPEISGEYTVQVDNKGQSPLSNKVDIFLGVRTKEVLVDLNMLFGGSGLNVNGGRPVYYLGPQGGAGGQTVWRLIHIRSLDGFPSSLTNETGIKVKEKVWSEKSNTFFDVIGAFLLLPQPKGGSGLFFTPNNHLVLRNPYGGTIDQTIRNFMYNTQEDKPAGDAKNPAALVDGVVTVNFPLGLVNISGSNRIVPASEATVTVTGDAVWSSPYKFPNFDSDWALLKQLLVREISKRSMSVDWRNSIFASEFNNHVQGLLGGNKKILDFKALAEKKLLITYQD